MMLVHGLRLLVAIITFVVGVGAGRLFGSESKPCGRAVVSYAPVHVPTPPLEAPPAPPQYPLASCFTKPPMRTVNGGLIEGKAVSKPLPVYPPAAKAAGVEGTVVVRVQVNDEGRVAFADATSGPEMLRKAAEEAARGARFTPTRLSGEPVWVTGVITYDFVLQ